MKKNIIFFMTGNYRINLNLVLADVFFQNGHQITFVVDNKEAFDAVNVVKKYEIKKYSIFFNENKIVIDKKEVLGIINNTIDIDTHRFTLNQAISTFYQTLSILSELKLDNTIIFGTAGCHIEDLAIKFFKNKNKNKFDCCFSELCNIEGKTFFDPCGANLNSLFYQLDDSVVSNINVDDYNNLFDDFIHNVNLIRREKNFKPKQSLKITIKKNSNDILNDLLSGFRSTLLMKIISLDRDKYITYLRNYFSNKKSIRSNKLAQDIPLNFLFIPLQVSTDTQLLYNSNYNNIETIKYYKNKADNLGLDVVVKLHPAEKSIDEINKISDFCSENNIYITDINTYTLIEKSKMVGVNNSTVGLEAIFLKKDVEFIGNTFYKKFTNKKWLYFYLFEYLIDIDFFNPKLNDLEKNKLYIKLTLHIDRYNN